MTDEPGDEESEIGSETCNGRHVVARASHREFSLYSMEPPRSSVFIPWSRHDGCTVNSEEPAHLKMAGSRPY